MSKKLKLPTTPELAIHIVDINRSGIRKVLGDLEAEIMELIWSHSTLQGITVRDVFVMLEQRRTIAYTTVMNTMTRLAKKNLLRAEKSELAYIYHPIYTQNELVTKIVDLVIGDLLVSFSGETTRALTQLVEAGTDEETLTRLKRLSGKIQARRKNKPQNETTEGN